MAGVVPLEQRKGSSDVIVNRTKGMYYGAYQ
jgi:hypothetical protein